MSIPDRPGELAKLMRGLKEAKISLRGIWGFGLGGGRAEVICVPQSPHDFRRFADAHDLSYAERRVVFLSGPNQVGALVDTVEKIANADINVHSVDAVSLDEQYGAYIWASEADRDALETLLGV